MAGMLALQSVFLVATGNVPIYFWIPCMIAAVSLMVGFIYFCCDVNFQDAGYFGMIAFVVAEFMASMEWQIVCSVWTNELPGRVIKIIMLAAAVSYTHLKDVPIYRKEVYLQIQQENEAAISADGLDALNNLLD